LTARAEGAADIVDITEARRVAVRNFILDVAPELKE
jgi:hypothetical protein